MKLAAALVDSPEHDHGKVRSGPTTGSGVCEPVHRRSRDPEQGLNISEGEELLGVGVWPSSESVDLRERGLQQGQRVVEVGHQFLGHLGQSDQALARLWRGRGRDIWVRKCVKDAHALTTCGRFKNAARLGRSAPYRPREGATQICFDAAIGGVRACLCRTEGRSWSITGRRVHRGRLVSHA